RRQSRRDAGRGHVDGLDRPRDPWARTRYRRPVRADVQGSRLSAGGLNHTGIGRRRTPVWVIARGPGRWDDMRYLRRLSPGGPGERPRGTRRPSPVAAPPRARVRRSPSVGTPPLDAYRGGVSAGSGPPRGLPAPERVVARGRRSRHAPPVPRPATHAWLRTSSDRTAGRGDPHLLPVGGGRRPASRRSLCFVGETEGRQPAPDGPAAERSAGVGRSASPRGARRRVG